jgi:hypothetical protein
MKNKVVKLENIFSGDIVFCFDIKETKDIDGISFIRVFKEENKKRNFLVNRSAFKVLNK